MPFQEDGLDSYAKKDSISATYAKKSSMEIIATKTSLATLEVSSKFLLL